MLMNLAESRGQVIERNKRAKRIHVEQLDRKRHHAANVADG
jgi:hypothetical protein